MGLMTDVVEQLKSVTLDGEHVWQGYLSSALRWIWVLSGED